MSRAIWIGVVFVVYLLSMLAVGLYFLNRSAVSHQDYFLGGRKLNRWVTALSAQASDMSGWLLLGLPGLAYLSGLGEASWIALGLALGTWINWRFVARRLRIYTLQAGDAMTLPDFFENRFQSRTRMLRVVSALAILVFFLIYTAAQFAAGAKLFHVVFDIPYPWGLLIGAAVIIGYTFAGGFLAVCWTDLYQGLLMFFALAIVPVMAVWALGGPSATAGRLTSMDAGFLNPWMAPGLKPLTGMTIASSLAWGLGYFGMPHILVRFMAIKDAAEIRPARTIAMVWVAVSLVAAVLVGVTGRALLPETLAGASSEQVFIRVADHLFPTVLAGLLLAAILAAIMSTADSQLLVAASALAHDIYGTLLKPGAPEREKVRVGRLTVGLLSAVALLLALNPDNTIFGLVSYAWAGLGASFGPVMLAALFWRRATLKGAAAGMIVGGLTVLIWKPLTGGVFDLYELLPGFVFAALATVAGSLLDRPPSPEVLREFDAVRHNRC